MATGGPLESVTIDGRRFAVDGEVNADIALAGFTNEVKPNGDGSYRLVKSRKPAKSDKIPIVLDDSRGDHEFIQERMDSADFFPVDFTKVTGVVMSGNMQITGDPAESTKESTMEITFMGGLKRQGV
ncbi:MAG: hypothetical protein PHS93_07960 [Candidatus Omnitrophica bacterium]|nr:hypothetical protein [Methanocellales archaeon]MDD5353077.1 hypothetical protein [Candidatus Omnitrophota bacterium]